jgi:hypothetical protein
MALSKNDDGSWEWEELELRDEFIIVYDEEDEMSVKKKWDDQMKKVPAMDPGPLDRHISLSSVHAVGDVTSDRVRYITFEGEPGRVACLGDRADFVAYAASQYHELRQEVERLTKFVQALENAFRGRGEQA